MPKFLEVSDTGAARAVLAISQINVLQYIADPDDPDTHTAGFQAAINAAVEGDGNEIIVPAGDWYVDGLIIPKKTPLTIRGQNGTAFPQEDATGGTLGTRIHRSDNLPIIIGIGGTAPTVTSSITDNNTSLPEVQWTDLVSGLVVEDITFINDNASATSPLIDLRAAAGLRFNRCTLFDANDNADLLDLTATQDSNFISCYFLGGKTGIRIRSGNDPYFACNALWFIACDVENYGGPGVDIGGNSVANDVPRLIHFSDHKMESKATSGPHFVIREGTGIMFSSSYISHWNTTGPVMDLQAGNGIYGDLGFIQIFLTGYEDPSSRINVESSVNYVDLTVYLHVGPGTGVNVITQATTTNETVNIRVNGVSQNVNDATRPYRWDRTGTIFQKSDASTACQYAFQRTGLNSWYVGNPSNPSGDQQQFTVTAVDGSGNTQDFLRLRSYSHTSGSNPATATYRDLQLPGFLNLSNTTLGWVNFQDLISPPAAPVGGYRLYSSSGVLRLDGQPLGVKVSVPASGTATGKPGQWAADANYIYAYTGDGSNHSWVRSATTAW